MSDSSCCGIALVFVSGGRRRVSVVVALVPGISVVATPLLPLKTKRPESVMIVIITPNPASQGQGKRRLCEGEFAHDLVVHVFDENGNE